MNIIIRSETEYQLTEYNKDSIYDINNIKIYSSTIVPTNIALKYEDSTNPLLAQAYSIPIIPTEIKENDYILYTAIAGDFIQTKLYDVTLAFENGARLQLEEPLKINNDILQDEHDAIKITGRTIAVNNNSIALIAQDCRSQRITFLIKESYDGISFLDENKEIYIDYIPPSLTPSEDIPFYSDNNLERYVDDSLSINGEQWMKLIWTIPYEATKQQGTVKFALSVVGKLVNGDCYIWQTAPAQFSVQPNIGQRPGVPVIPNSNPESFNIEKRIASLEEFTANIDNVTAIDQDNGTITHISRENGKDSEEISVSIANLWAAGLQDDEIIIDG